MIQNPTYFVTPTAYWLAPEGSGNSIATADPIGDCIREACDGDSLQLVPGLFPRAKGPWGGKQNIHICGWNRTLGVSTIVRDEATGSSDNFILGAQDSGFVLESLNIELDDRAGVKTTAGVGPKHALIDVWMYGRGTPHDPLWKDSAKWGVHAYETSGWNEVRCLKWGIYGEHGGYFHNIQGVHNFAEGGAGYLSGCDLFFANRMNEGPIGKGHVNVKRRTVKEACIGQGGSVFTFRGGMPESDITLDEVTVRLGCDPNLAAPFNQNICGVISVDSADETEPGRNDAAWPGGTRSLTLVHSDIEVGTVWPGRTGMLRPVIQLSSLGSFTMRDTRIQVRRPSGAYPIALAIAPSVQSVRFGGVCDVDGWVDYHGTRFTSWALFKNAYPELFIP